MGVSAPSLMLNAVSAIWRIDKVKCKGWQSDVQILIGSEHSDDQGKSFTIYCSLVYYLTIFESLPSVQARLLGGFDAARWSCNDIIAGMCLWNLDNMVYFDFVDLVMNTVDSLIASWHFLVSSSQTLMLFGLCCLTTPPEQTQQGQSTNAIVQLYLFF